MFSDSFRLTLEGKTGGKIAKRNSPRDDTQREDQRDQEIGDRAPDGR
jgi:hypothetical protein